MADQFEPDHNEDHNQEGWQDTQPPVDTFHDADMHAEGMATVSEETGEHEEYDKSAPSEGGSVKKSSKLIPLAAGAGVLLVIAAVLFWQFGMSSSAPTTVTAQMPALKPPAAPLGPSDPSAMGNAMSIPDDGKAKTPDQATAPLSDSVATNINATTTVGGAAVPSTADAPSAITPNTVPQPLMNTMGSPQVSAISQGVGQNAGGALIPQHPGANVGHNTELSALSTHVDDMQKSLDQITQQLSQVSSLVAAQANALAAANNNTVSPEVEERLNKIEQHLVQIEHAAPPALSSPPAAATQVLGNPAIATAKPDLTTSENPTKSPSSSSSHTHAAKSHHAAMASLHNGSSKHKRAKPVDSEVSNVTVAPTPTTGMLEVPHGAWILRAATPNEAWVAKNASSSDLTHVRLGESLPGIGQVQSIRPVGDTWVIEGTEGVVR